MNRYLDDDTAARLRTHLELTTRSISTSAAASDTIAHRATRRQARRRAISVTSTVALVALTAAAAVVVLNRDPHTIVSGPSGTQSLNGSVPAPIVTSVGDQTAVTMPRLAPPSTTPGPTMVQSPHVEFAALAPILATESEMVWNRIDVDSAEALTLGQGFRFGAIVEGDGSFYAVDTEPGRAEQGVKPQVWNSSDGIHWKPQSAPIDGIGRLGAGGGKLYTLSTVSAVAGGVASNLAARVSNDGGKSWTPGELLLDLDPIRALPGVTGAYVVLSDIAASDARVLVMAKAEISVDWGALDSRLQNQPWRFSGNGSAIEVIESCGRVTEAQLMEAKATGVDPCPQTVTAVIPLAGLLDPRLMREMNRVHLFTSTDGEQFEEIDTNAAGLPRHTGGNARLAHTERGFLYVASLWGNDNRGVERYFESADGTTWDELPELEVAGRASTVAIGVIDGRYMLVNTTGAVLQLSNDGAWEGVDLRALLPVGDSIAWIGVNGEVSESGVTVALSVTYDEIAKVGGIELTSLDGYTIRRESSVADFVVTDPQGRSVPAEIGWDDRSTIRLFDPAISAERGPVILTTWTSAEVGTLMNGRSARASTFLLHSVDGVTWSVEEVDLGPESGVQSVDAAGAKVVVRTYRQRQPGQPETQAMLIGTPKG